MRRIILLILAVGMLTLPTANAYSQTQNDRNTQMTQAEISKVTKADEAHSFSEYEAVAKALQPYIESAKTGDGKLSRSAFHDHANIVGTVNGEYYEPDADAFADIVTEGGASPDVQHHIAWIDISGPAAAAKVEFVNWGGFRFTDFFVLFKKDGEWKISSKVYDSHSNN